MTFGRKIATRILLAYLAPLAFMLILGITFVYATGRQFSLLRYSLGQLVVLITALLVGRIFTRPLAARIAQLLAAAQQIERGEYGARLDVGRSDGEFADLARAFNHMADVIAQREREMREQNQILAALNHRMESVLNATNDGIAMLNREGCFALVNRRFGDLLGARAEDLLHRPIAEVQPHLVERLSQPERLMRRFAGLTLDDLRDPVGVAEEVVELTGPERRFLQVYTAPVQGEDGGEVIGRVIALRDVTRERELDKMKTEFISVVSHELRTPLTSIKGYTDLLLSDAMGPLSAEEQREFLGIIQSSTTRLTNLINDILDISRIESGRIEIKHEPVDYRQIVDEVLRLMRAPADEKRVALIAPLPESLPPVQGDTDKVTQVLTNLVSNAIKYTPVGGQVTLGLEINGDASVTTCIADTGIGISAEDQKRLFQRFFRADNSSTREAGGTGLGLVIAKQIVELLGGAIWVESESGRGSRFYFTLPLYTDAAPAAAATPRLPDRGIGLVMVVDDDAYLRGLIEHQLHRRGYGVVGAGSTADALQKARQHKPDAITLDLMMPDMAGFDLLRALKQDPATAGIPAVLISLVGDPARGGLSLGAFSFLQKPLDAVRLAETAAAAMVSTRGELPRPRQGPWARVLLVQPPGGDEQAMIARLAEQGLAAQVVASAADAVAQIVLESPDIVLIDMDLPQATVFDLMGALKAEEEAARIPIVFLTDDIAEEGIHFHLGGDPTDNTVSLDYICEQLSRVLGAPREARPSPARHVETGSRGRHEEEENVTV